MGRTKLYQTPDELMDYYGLSSYSRDKQGNRIKIDKKETREVYLRGKKISSSNNVALVFYTCSNGKPIRQNSGYVLNIETSAEVKKRNEETLRQARVKADELNTEVQKKGNGFVLSKKNNVNLCEYILFLADEALKKSGNKHGYYYTLISLSKHIEQFNGKETAFKEVDKDFILRFFDYLKTANNFNHQRAEDEDRRKEVKLSQNTQHNLYMKFKYVLRKAVKAEILPFNPMDKLENSDKPKAEDGTREYLTISEIKQLIATPCKNDIIKKAFLFCCLTGLRYSDISALTWGEVRKEEGVTKLSFKMKKVKRANVVFLSDEALKWIPKRSGMSDIVFNLPKNDNANRQLARWAEIAGIEKKVTFHCSRHTAATLNLGLGTPIETVSSMLGHTKISTTQIYAKILDENQKKAVNKQNGLFD